jgi:hypothetical protein
VLVALRALERDDLSRGRELLLHRLELLLEGAQPTLHLVTLRGDAGLLAASG